MANKNKKNEKRKKEFMMRSREAYKKALNDTVIEVSYDDFSELYANFILGYKRSDTDNPLMMSPLFTSYTIHITGDSTSDKLLMVKWLSDTKYTVTVLTGRELFVTITVDNERLCKPRDTEAITYKFHNDTVDKVEEYRKRSTEWVKHLLVSALSVTNYMLKYSTEVEYETVERGTPVAKSKDTKGSTSKPVSALQSSNTITITSKRKKYIITGDMVKESKKQYNKRTACWNVRGYYQHFGKNKVLKYVPPRVNVRKDMSGTAINKKYIIKGDNNNGTK